MKQPGEIKDKVCGWIGLVLVFAPILKLIPGAGPYLEILSETGGAACQLGGAALLASSNKIIKK